MNSAAGRAGVFIGRILAAAVGISTFFPLLVEAQGARGRIAGTVHDVTGTPASGAVVALRGPAARDLRSGEDGRFDVELLPDGTYTVTATLPGFAPASRDVKIAGGRTVGVALILLPLILEEVTVAAGKTGERDLQKVPMAVSVLSGAQLTQLEAHTVADLTGLAPGLTVAQNTGFSQLTIRGIGQ